MRTLVLILCAFTLAACGRAGDPLKPSQSRAQAAKDANLPVPPAPTPNSRNEGKRFILDGLLE